VLSRQQQIAMRHLMTDEESLRAAVRNSRRY
jgi:hypothetical protein